MSKKYKIKQKALKVDLGKHKTTFKGSTVDPRAHSTEKGGSQKTMG